MKSEHNRHRSYLWLLSLLSAVTFCDKRQIEQKVCELEEALGTKLGFFDLSTHQDVSVLKRAETSAEGNVHA
jgi:hypothetical protein